MVKECEICAMGTTPLFYGGGEKLEKSRGESGGEELASAAACGKRRFTVGAKSS